MLESCRSRNVKVVLDLEGRVGLLVREWHNASKVERSLFQGQNQPSS